MNMFSSEEEILVSIFDRKQRELEARLVRYVDIRLSPDAAARLLLTACESGDESKNLGEKPAKILGRKKNLGPYVESDKVLAEEMDQGRLQGTFSSTWAAAMAMSTKAEGSKNGDSAARRLVAAYKKHFPMSPWND